MMRKYCTTIVCILWFVVGCGQQGDTDVHSENGSENVALDSIFAAWDLPGSPGCALAVAQDGVLDYSHGYGFANLDYDIPITPQTIFDIASVTKQFNAASISMLALEGKLSLDDNIRDWLPDLPEYEWPITLRHMLHHTSGLRDYLTLFPLAGRNDYYPISHARILAMMSRQRGVDFPPGDKYEYSNTAYMLLSQVVEQASGQTLGEFTEERIFGPLEMDDSFMYEDFEAVVPYRATGYVRDDDGRLRIVHNYNFDVAGDGQMYATMEDLLLWDNYLHGEEKPEIHPLMLTEGYLNNGDPVGYAQGIRLDEYRGLSTLRHSGSSWGFRTELVRFIEPRLSIAISCNMGDVDPSVMAQRVADHYLVDELGPAMEDEGESNVAPLADEAPVSPTLTVEELAEYAGSYYAPELDAAYHFAVVGNVLMVRIEQEAELSAVAIGSDEFEVGFQPAGWGGGSTLKLEFDRNRAGAVIGFGLTLGSLRGIVFEKGEDR